MIPLRHVFVASIISFLAFTLLGLWLVNEKVSPVLMEIAKAKTKQIATYAINSGLGKQEIHEMEQYQSDDGKSDLYTITYDKDDQITSVNYNMVAVTRIFSEVTQKIQQYLRAVEEGTINPVNTDFNDTQIEGGEKGVIAKIPLGQATENVLFSNLGPTIPVRMVVTSNVIPNIKNEVKEVNINGAYIQIYLAVKVQVKVVLPFETKNVSILTTIPITSQYLPGKVPNYYSSGKDNTSIAIPQKMLDKDDYSSKKTKDKKGNE
ncbi:sporulation protein YunB [Pullulanibacillus camelliae]|uniref:Sporulation protein YunB n=2 Tax=Pullulanibacillus camelliae TaxID=1707096 RepID=A0A8J2YK43_9BACL|nr:sporulation protein YunB [Pullulanibacillus camelliae]